MVATFPLNQRGGKTTMMGNGARIEPQRLSSLELQAIARALELDWPTDALVQGTWWPGKTEDTRNYKVTLWTTHATPLTSTWIAERSHGVYRLCTRPASADEVALLLEALRELDAFDSNDDTTIAEAQYDCRERVYQLCFTALEEMIEGLRYERWVFRRHLDGRPLSVGYIFETRRGDAYATVPGGAVLRGNPWPDEQ
jgi:hypothetical protein